MYLAVHFGKSVKLNVGKFIAPGAVKLDGMLIKQAIETNLGTMSNVGFVSGPIGPEESQALADLTDIELSKKLKEDPLACEMVEVMFTMGDNSVTGHLGCFLSSNGGKCGSVDGRFGMCSSLYVCVHTA
jgi:hypothetical protein